MDCDHNSRNILDKIYTNIPSWFHTPIVLPPIGTSDHNTLLLCTVDSRSVMSNQSRVDYSYVRSNDNSRKTFLAHALKNHNWSLMYSMDETVTLWSRIFIMLFTAC